MSIVLHGLGVGEIDSGSSIVAFGLARDLDEGETVEQAVASTGIENLFVVDFGGGQRQANAAEFRRFKRMVAAMQLGSLQFRERKGKKGGIEYWAVRDPLTKKAA
jgi:hypothetical protein